MPLLNESNDGILTCSVQPTNIKIQYGSNKNGNAIITNINKKEPSQQPDIQSLAFKELYDNCCEEKQYLDDSDDFEENPPKKRKIDSQNNLYAEDDPEINDIIMQYEKF